MLHFLRMVILLSFGSALALIGTHLIGALHSSPLAALFSNADGSTCNIHCLLAIEPGKTKFDDVGALFRSHPLSNEFVHGAVLASNGYLWLGKVAGVMLHTGKSQGQAGIIHFVVLNTNVEMNNENLTRTSLHFRRFNAGDLFLLLGTPDAIQIGRNEVFFFYLHSKPVMVARQQVSGANYRIDPNDTITSLALYDLGLCKFAPEQGFNMWLGFRTVQRYNAAGLKRLIAVPQSIYPYSTVTV